MSSSGKQLKIGAILSYVSIAVNIIAGLIYTPWMINQIGKSNYGLYTLANSLISLFLVDFGLSSATARYVSKYHAEGDEEKVNNFLGVIYKLYLIIDAIIFTILLVVFFFIDQIYVNLTPQEIEKFKIVYIISASFAVFNFPFVTQNGILTAYEKFIQIKLADIIYRVLIVGFTILALIFGYGLYALVGVHALVGLFLILYKFIVLRKTVPARANLKYSDNNLFKSVLKFSIWTTVTLLAQRLIFNITPTILGITVGSEAIAIFGVVTVVEGYTYTITTAINGMFMPRISKEYALSKDGDISNFGRRIQPLFENIGKYQFAVNGIIIVGFALLGSSFINLWMGDGYQDAYIGILMVVIPGLFYNTLQVANTSLIVVNKVKIQAIIMVISGLINLVLSFILSYFYGVIGACFSIFVAYSVKAILTNIVAKRILKLDISRFIRKCYVRMLIPCLITLALGIGLNYLLVGSGWLMFAIKVIIIIAIYLIFTFFIGLSKTEKQSVFGFIKKKLRIKGK